MDNNHFYDLVWQAKNIGADEISPFGYGEPMMDKDIVLKVDTISSFDLRSFITTNGSLVGITKGFELIDAGLSHIRFSVHGMGDDYEAVHRNLSWVKTRDNILTFMKANRKNGNSVKVDISYIPTGLYTTNDLKAVVNFWQKRGVDDIEIWQPHNWTNGKKFRTVDRALKTCGRPQNGPVQINADGKMMVCCFDFDAKLTVGDTHKDSIHDILKNKMFKYIRAKHEIGDVSGLICETCDQLNEGDSPLIFSTVDKELNIGTTSSTKFRLL